MISFVAGIEPKRKGSGLDTVSSLIGTSTPQARFSFQPAMEDRVARRPRGRGETAGLGHREQGERRRQKEWVGPGQARKPRSVAQGRQDRGKSIGFPPRAPPRQRKPPPPANATPSGARHHEMTRQAADPNLPPWPGLSRPRGRHVVRIIVEFYAGRDGNGAVVTIMRDAAAAITQSLPSLRNGC